MTTPPEEITVECPECGEVYRDWYRASLNLDLDDFDEAYIGEASTATCPACGHQVRVSNLIVEEGGRWVLGDDAGDDYR